MPRPRARLLAACLSAFAVLPAGAPALAAPPKASPHVAGAAALILDQYPAFTPAQVRDRLVRNATTGKVAGRGTGSPDRLLFVPAPPAATTVRTASLPAAHHGETYSAQLTVASPRTGTWAVSGGTLPPGLKLTAKGLLTGTPTATGVYPFTVRFTDFVPRAATRSLTLTIEGRRD